METSKLANASLDDIVFEGRNKAYGAYLLRKMYNKHVTVAAIIASTLFLILISMPLIARLLETEKEPEPVIERVITQVDLAPPPPLEENTPPPPPPPPPPPDAPPPPPPVRAQVKFTPPVVKRDNEVQKEEEVPDVEELKGVDIGTKTVEGVKGAPPDFGMGVVGGTGDVVVAEVVEEKPYTFAEQMPSFPGGEKAMFEYLGKNMKYPRQAINAGIEGQVFVSFVVSKTGEISDIQVLRGLGAGCDEEAIRVIKGMPKWTPGKQNGRAVPVRYNLPVKFTLK
ncbi:energy transducer TonB [Botryobacter ruber]|uniref:energy transducer TonB n=1 Tax=Botryobacter ruber TaxID=2171629 RepID=UPI000E0C8667|nr:energy transducer TonB [Botryobacter ruber]